MKILITYVSAGAGHRRSAEALHVCFRQAPGLDARIIDVLEFSRPAFKKLYINGYQFLVHYALWLWQFSFWLTSLSILRGTCSWLNAAVNQITARSFERFLLREQPDIVISTHFLPSEVTARLKRTGRLNSRLVTVVTDFAVHPFWVCAGTDTYVVASPFAAGQLISSGIPRSHILEYGIPIDATFETKYDRQALRHSLGIPAEVFTVLIVTGSFGIGPIEEIVEILQGQGVSMMVVCARNRELAERLERRDWSNVKVFQFVDNMQELMAASDLIITKPGGLTIAEILAMELVPVFISAIPGQETKNSEVLAGYGIGHRIRRIDEIREVVLGYRMHQERLAEMKEKIRQLQKPSAARELCNALCKGGVGDIR